MHTSQMLGREFVDSPISVASQDDIQAFEQKKHAGPSKADFRLHLTGSLRSGWNKQAAAVFAEDFVNIGVSDCRDQVKIQRMFNTHLTTLRSQFMKQLRGDEGPTEAEFDRLIEEKRDHRRRAVRILLAIHERARVHSVRLFTSCGSDGQTLYALTRI